MFAITPTTACFSTSRRQQWFLTPLFSSLCFPPLRITAMPELPHSFSPDCGTRLQNYLRAEGLSSLSELLASHPNRTYSEIASLVGKVAPIQLIAIQFQEAKKTGRTQDAVKDCLVRNLNEQLPKGWGVGEKAEWKSVLALSSWSSEVKVTGDCDYLDATLFAIVKSLRALPPPTGWTPLGINDPIIGTIFDSCWQSKATR